MSVVVPEYPVSINNAHRISQQNVRCPMFEHCYAPTAITEVCPISVTK